jgi:uncharacterized membrane protein
MPGSRDRLALAQSCGMLLSIFKKLLIKGTDSVKCFTHPDIDASATCQSCSQGLCKACASRFDIMFCEGCLLSHNRTVTSQLYRGLAITGGIFLVCLYLISQSESSSGDSVGVAKAIVPSLLFAFIYWGWKFLSGRFFRLQAASAPIWVIYMAIKLQIAVLIGILVGPYQIFNTVRELRKANQTKRDIQAGLI